MTPQQAFDSAVKWFTSRRAVRMGRVHATWITADGSEPVGDSDARMTDARVPLGHGTTHMSGGSDEVKHSDLSGIGTNSHPTIDTHLAATQPHPIDWTPHFLMLD